jgi:hypothetical protein
MDIQSYFQMLDRNTQEAVQLASACADQELKIKKENKWSIIEILEHIAITDRLVLSFLTRPSANSSENDVVLGFEKLNRILVGMRARKIVAPDFLQPKGEIGDIESFEKIFRKQRELLKKSLETGKIVLDNRTYKHPIMGEMTVRDWLNFMPLHAQRHLDQIKELRENFKKNSM